MRYLGGKRRLAKKIVPAIAERLRGRPVWDAFCGGLSMAVSLSEHTQLVVSDGNRALITLYQSIADGWVPPVSMSEGWWRFCKTLPDDQPLKAFAGFACAFGGDWGGHYARNDANNDYARQGHNSLLRDVPLLKSRGCRFDHIDFLSVVPAPTPLVLYLDPPYAGTTGYSAMPPFNHERFYALVQGWARHTDVFVSEYRMPFGTPLVEVGHTLESAGGARKEKRVERLYHYGPGVQ